MFEGHTAPIVALAMSPDGATLASASWDQHGPALAARMAARRACSKAITQNVNGVAFTADGRRWLAPATISASHLAAVGCGAPTVVAMPTPLNAVAVGADGEIAAGGADGKVYFLTAGDARAGEVAAGPTPVISIAISADGALVAAAGIGGIGRR